MKKIPSNIIAVGTSSFGKEDDAPIRLLEKEGFVVKLNPWARRLNATEIASHIADARGLLAGLEPLNEEVVSQAPFLQAIARVGVGMDNVDEVAMKKKNILVSNTPEAPANAVAELCLAALLNISRGIVSANTELHAGRWTKGMGRSISGLKVLLIGYGRIGQKTASLLRSFNATVLVFDPYNEDGAVTEGIVRVETLAEGLAQVDVVSLHANGVQPILGEKEFALLKDGAILLNGARGELVDELALIKALESKKVKAAWLDAFWDEPYKGRLLEFEQVLLTPHMGTYTRECRREMEMTAAENLLRDLALDG